MYMNLKCPTYYAYKGPDSSLDIRRQSDKHIFGNSILFSKEKV